MKKSIVQSLLALLLSLAPTPPASAISGDLRTFDEVLRHVRERALQKPSDRALEKAAIQALKVELPTRITGDFLSFRTSFKDTPAASLRTQLETQAIQGLVGSLQDPYARYLSPKSFQQMNDARIGYFGGIGVQLGVRQGRIIVVESTLKTPADKAGILPNDLLLSVNGQSVRDLAITQVTDMIRGPIDSRVQLTLQRGELPLQMTLARAQIDIHAVKSTLLEDGVGYIAISSLMPQTVPDEVSETLQMWQDVGLRSLILDFRGNSGGLLNNAVELARLFLPTGDIVQVIERGGQKRVLRSKPPSLLPSDIPLVILIDQASASASEILAAALQDNHRAYLIGTRSFGKGLVQTVIPLEDGSGLILTTQRYLTPTGQDIHRRGIAPNQMVQGKAARDSRLSEDQSVQAAIAYLKGLSH